MKEDVVIGIDLGTGGARVMAVTANGNIAGEARQALVRPSLNPRFGFEEQDPADWQNAVFGALKRLMIQLNERYRPIAGAVDATSGTIVPVGKDGQPLYAGIMHNDTRAVSQTKWIAQVIGKTMSPTFALPKLLWLRDEEPDIYKRSAKIIHQADWIVGSLTDNYGVSDTFNVLKMGYDLTTDSWPSFMDQDLSISLSLLPEVVRPGSHIGNITADTAIKTGIPEGMPIMAGATDSNAAFFASGAGGEGDWNVTLGTTLAFKGITQDFIDDPLGRVYCHRHPDGMWLPGGASNTGADWIKEKFRGHHEDYPVNAANPPAKSMIYPLVRQGERFPFLHNQAEGFVIGDTGDKTDLFRGHMEGLAYIERWCTEVLEGLGAPIHKMYATGGGAQNRDWLQIRANVLNRPFARAQYAESAKGVAIVAASSTFYSSVSEACRHMVTLDLEIQPKRDLVEQYQKIYTRFREEMTERGYC